MTKSDQIYFGDTFFESQCTIDLIYFLYLLAVLELKHDIAPFCAGCEVHCQSKTSADGNKIGTAWFRLSLTLCNQTTSDRNCRLRRKSWVIAVLPAMFDVIVVP